MKALITRKIAMTSTIADDGVVTAVTVLSAEPHAVTQIKTLETDGYNAVQLGTGRKSRLGKSLAGHFKAAGIMPGVVREFRISEQAIPDDLTVGAAITADVFEPGDSVDVTGTSKGKGWAGTIRRHNFHRGRKTHGGRSYRRVGSIGSMYPQKIFKGKKMAGHLGHDNVTVKNLKIAFVDVQNNLIGVTGAVPGPRKGIVIVRQAVRHG